MAIEVEEFEEDEIIMDEEDSEDYEDEVDDEDMEDGDNEDEVDVHDDDMDEEDVDLGGDNVHELEEPSQQASTVAAAVAPASPDVRVSARTAVANVTVCDADALECGVCFLALRPPIFQCEVGHVVCSACRDKLVATANGKCHVCRAATRSYRRCYAMERLVDCLHVPCPYAAHGCDATPPYYGLDSHRQVCLHAPCHCPGKSCGFVGSTAALLDHFACTHNWPCYTKVRAGKKYNISLRVGFNFLVANHDGGDGDQAAKTCSVLCRLFLLNVTEAPLGRAISMLCIHPHANSVDQRQSTQCKLSFERSKDGSSCRSHYQSSVFEVVCSDLSNGLPNPEGCFQFFVHNAVLGAGDDKNSMQVNARITN